MVVEILFLLSLSLPFSLFSSSFLFSFSSFLRQQKVKDKFAVLSFSSLRTWLAEYDNGGCDYWLIQ